MKIEHGRAALSHVRQVCSNACADTCAPAVCCMAQAKLATAGKGHAEDNARLAHEHQRIAVHLSDLQAQMLRMQLADLKKFHEVSIVSHLVERTCATAVQLIAFGHVQLHLRGQVEL